MAGAARCVYCRAEPVSDRYRPFCSDRCKMADLGRWLKGDYAVPASENRGTDQLEIGDLEIETLDSEDDR